MASAKFNRIYRSFLDVQLSASRWSQRCKSSPPPPQTSFLIDGDFSEAKTLDDNEWNRALPFDKVPGPNPLPLIGNNWRFLPYIGQFNLNQLDDTSQYLFDLYGPCVKLTNIIGRPDIVFIADPDEIEKVFRNEDQFPYRPSMPSLVYYKNVLRKDFFGKYGGVLSVQGETWSSFRSKVQQAMLQPRTAKLYIGAIEEAANALVDRARSIKDENEEMPANFMNELNKWSLESIANIALDTRLGCLDAKCPEDTQQLIDAVTTFFINVRILELKYPFWKYFSTPTWRGFINALDTIWRISLHHIEAAMQRSKDNPDSKKELSLLQRLLASNTNDPHIAVVMALEMFIVGIDTVSTAVSSTLYQLAQHQDVQEKLYEEISSILPSKDVPMTAANLEDMHYLKSCIKENFRMFPTVLWNARHLSRDTVVHGYQIPKGTMIIFLNYVVCRQDKFFADSLKFRPERWLKSQHSGSSSDDAHDKSGKSECPQHHAFASLPFGYGKRMCLGKRFADLEMQAVICKMVQNFKIENHYENKGYHMKPMYMPKGELKFKLTDRN